MGIRAKFNLVLLLAFVVGLGLASAISYRIVVGNARREVEQEAAIMMAQAIAIRTYTNKEIRPLLAEQMQHRFLPDSVPSWAAQTNFHMMSKQFPDYDYKEAALNPTNLEDRASDWEADIINQFRHNAELTEFATVRDTPAGPILSVSRPLRIVDKDCLVCHTTAAEAPPTMVAIYGSTNGYGWKLNEVIGAQIVSVPMQVPLDRANHLFLIYVGGLTIVFGITILLLNLLLHFVIIRPIRRMSTIASEISLGNTSAPEFTAKGHDEVASLAQSFNRMRRSLVNAMQMLEV
jgi:HAMP domain-containing protein